MPADNILGFIAADPLRSDVPADYIALGIKHKDAVIDHPGHQQSKPFVAASQQLLRPFSLANVADRTHGKSAFIGVEGTQANLDRKLGAVCPDGVKFKA